MMDGDSPVVMGKVVGHSPVVADDSAKLPSRSHGLGLFRPESLTDRPERWLGEVSLAVPVTFTVYAVCALATIAALVVFLLLGSYTPRERATAIMITPRCTTMPPFARPTRPRQPCRRVASAS